MKKLEIISFSEINEQDWTRFHQSCSDPVLFYQYPFLSAYQETTGEGIDVLIYKEDDKTLIMLPGSFHKKKKLFSNLTFLGWDNLSFLMLNRIQEDIINDFITELFKIIDLVIYKNISQSCYETIAKHTVGAIAFKKFKCPFISLPNSYQEYLESRSVSFKRMLKNRTNFCEKHGVSFRFLSNTNKGTMDDAFRELNRLHGKRMDELNTKSKFLKPDSQRFHEILRSKKNDETILILQAVENEKVIGTLYGLVSSDRYAYFAAGINSAYAKYSLGVVLIGRVMDYLISNNFKYFDFLRGTEDYKFKWTNEINQNYTVYSFSNIFGKSKGVKQYWKENKKRLGRKQTLVNLKKFL